MDKIYTYILDGLRDANNLESEDELRCYLQNLKPYVIQLRKSYRASLVKVNYTEPDIQAAYLLAYYPQYAEMTLQILKSLKDSPFGQEYIHGCFFGSGPAPETVGWVTYLSNKFPNIEYAEAHTYDISADTWTFSRTITETHVAPSCWNGQLIINAESVNLCTQNSLRQLETIKNIIRQSTLFVIQNCLNEVAIQSDEFISNLSFLLNQMPDYGIIIVADLCEYDSVINLKRRIEAYIRVIPEFHIIRSHTDQGVFFRSSLTPPEIITTNLLTGENYLKPRMNVSYSYLVTQKLPEVQ